MRIGLVGCGRISRNHLSAIKQLKELQLAGVCDTDKNRADSAAEESGCNVYYDLDSMIEKEEMEIIAIMTPSGLHAEQAIKAANKGINLIVEKPMATRLQDADSLIKECDKNNVELFVVKQNRLNPTMQLLKKTMDKGRFGRIYMAVCNVLWSRPQSYYDMSKWRGTWEFDGGAFMNQGSHYVDAMQWLMGPVDYVVASTSTLGRKIETEDTGTATFKFRSGCIGSMNITMLTYHRNFEGSITIIGEKGTAKVGGVAVNKIEKWEFENYDDDDQLLESINYNPPNVYGYGHLVYYQNVLKYLKGEKIENIDGRSGRKSLEIIEAIYMSAKSNKKVSIPLV